MTGSLVSGRRIVEYFERRVPDRLPLRTTINEIKGRLPNTVIFGGMIRDFALAGARRFTSDVDLVSDADDSAVFDAIRAFSPKRNKFGGYRFNVAKWQFDIWSLPQTWAFKEKLVAGSNFDDLLKTTFFNVDAVTFHLSSEAIRTSQRFLEGVERRVLDVNLEDNPSPAGMARRAINMALAYDLAIGTKLVSYIVRHTTVRPSWIGETLWMRLLQHNASSDKPFHIAAQAEIPIPS